MCATVGDMTEEIIKGDLDITLSQTPPVNSRWSHRDASFSRRVFGLSVRNSNPPAESRWLFSDLTDAQRSVLEGLARRRETAHNLVRRTQIILQAASPTR